MLPGGSLLAQKKEKPNFQDLVRSKSFRFVAQSAMPLRGRTIQLTSQYFMKVMPDTIICDLPYYGRAYSAPIDPTEGGINFTSTDFDYDVANRKKGGWDITIKPKDTRDVRQLTLTVSENGYGTLIALSNNRQQISYYGQIEAIKP